MTKYFKVIMSNKHEVVLDQQDYDKLVNGMNSGSFVQLKKAIINPSFIMVIFPIKQKEALDTEHPPRKIEGYVDPERNVYVVTKDLKPVPTELKDEFKS